MNIFIRICSLASTIEALRCISCHSITFSDGFMQGHNPSGNGAACFNGTETNEVSQDGGQCKTVYINEWNLVSDTALRGQSDIKRIWTHEVGQSFDNSKVYSWGHYWKDCAKESCEIKENWAQDFIDDTNNMIQNNLPSLSKSGISFNEKSATCKKCSAFSTDREDQEIVDCVNGKGLGQHRMVAILPCGQR